jgi:molybdopterin molybdotransferase
MPEFLKLIPPALALEKWLNTLSISPRPEWLNTSDALGRTTFEDIVAPHPLPTFSRSTVDGYAVRARDTYGASDTLPAYLTLIGEVSMGEAASVNVSSQQCSLIHTGGMIPPGADAVVMLEQTQAVSQDLLEILKAVSPGENVINLGEDVTTGEIIFPKGTTLRSIDIGGLMAMGITQLQVARKPMIGIISCGDEVVSPDQPVEPGQVRDINGYSLSALAVEYGAEVKYFGILPDKLNAMQQIARTAFTDCEILVFTAGSSASTRDLTAAVIQELGLPGILIHGLTIRPGKPTILANCNGKAVLGLPGNPVSAYVIAWLFLIPIIRTYLGLSAENAGLKVLAELTENLPSLAGREDWVPVKLLSPPGSAERPLAEPIFSRSNNFFSLVRCDGLARIPTDANGVPAGSRIEVYLMK